MKQKFFTIRGSDGTVSRYRVSRMGTVIVDEDDPQENPSDPHFDPSMRSASTRRNHRLHDLRRRLPTVTDPAERQAIEAEIAILEPIVSFELRRFFGDRPPVTFPAGRVNGN